MVFTVGIFYLAQCFKDSSMLACVLTRESSCCVEQVELDLPMLLPQPPRTELTVTCGHSVPQLLHDGEASAEPSGRIASHLLKADVPELVPLGAIL